jgi:N-acetylmuramoyl-L-alanine amidase
MGEFIEITAAALLCLSSVIYHEAKGEPLNGQIAVAQVVVNRVNSNGKFPNTVCGVVKQRGQFSWVGKKPMTPAKKDLAREILEGKHSNNVKGALYFTNVGTWFKRKVLYVIGRHRFYG